MTAFLNLSCSLILLLTLFSWISSCTHTANIADVPEVCFTGDILHIFSNSCAIAGCHDGSGESHMALDNYPEIRDGVVPGNPDASNFYQVIISKWGNRMPPNEPLSLVNRTKIRIWIEQGAEPTTCSDTTGTGGNGGGNNYIARACFTRDIMPVVLSRCASAGCHDAISHKEGYNYNTYNNIRNSVTPGNPGTSKFYRSITVSGGEDKMPPAGSAPLTSAEIDSIGKWIRYGALNENCGEVCDTINPITFSGTIWPIMQTSCTGCHSAPSPGGGISIANYANVQVIAANGNLMNSLRGNGVIKMPQGSSFSACRIRQFQIWVNNGYSNN